MKRIPIFLRVSIPLTQAYEDDEMKLGDVDGQLVFRLFGAGGEAVAEAVAGIWKQTGLPITARLHVPYVFRMPEGVLELCGNDLMAEDAFSLFLCDADDRNRIRLRPHEAHCSGLCGEQPASLQKTLRSVWGYIKEACLDNGVSLRTKNPRPEALERLYAIYDRGMLRGVYDPDRDKFDPAKKSGVSLRPLGSIVPGTFTAMAAGTNVLNVIGSSGGMINGWLYPADAPKTVSPAGALVVFAGSWRSAWEIVTGAPVGSSAFCACAAAPGAALPAGAVAHACTTGASAFVGGHMVAGMLGAVVQNIAPGGNAIVFPICKQVNNNPLLQFQVLQAGGVNAIDITNFLI